MKLFYVFMLFLSVSLFARDSMNFAPLPMKDKKRTIQDFLPLTEYLKREKGLKIVYNYKADYHDILKGFQKGEIDIAYLGPLPLAILKSQYSYVKPIIAFRQADGKVHYRCVLSKFVDDTEPKDRPLRVALTQSLSTCGYYMTQKLLKREYHKDLKSQKYNYTMSHTNALIETLQGKYDIAGSSEKIAKKFELLGMEILAKSDYLPGFALVVNTKTLSSEKIEALQKAILEIKEEEYVKWGSKLRYGFESANSSLYDSIKIDETIPQKGNMR